MNSSKKEASDVFDSASFLDWIHEHIAQIRKKTEWLQYPHSAIEFKKMLNEDLSCLSSTEMYRAISRFPQQARKRSILDHILGLPRAWIQKDSTPSHQILCHEKAYAASPRAIVIGITDSIRQLEHHISQDIMLFEIRGWPQETIKYAQLQALMREYAHTMISPFEYDGPDEYVLSISAEYHAEARMFLSQFAGLVSKHSPISHMSEMFWPLPGASDPNFCRFVGKELSESVAAYLLGFSYCAEEKRWWNPFYDRPQVRELVSHFLQADALPASHAKRP
jgi:hypothetical protein